MYRIKTDLSVDTVRIYFKHIYFSMDSELWQRKGEEMYFCKRKDMRFTYVPKAHVLTSEFSASRLANGCNAFPYEYHQYPVIRDTVEREIFAVTGKTYLIASAMISRIDIYRTLEFDTMDKAHGFISALSTSPDAGRIKHIVYGDEEDSRSDYVEYSKGDLVKAYVKNEDPALPQEVRDILPPTVRIEAECKKNATAKEITSKYTADMVLKYPAIWVEIYNASLDIFERGGRILPLKTLIRTARMLLKEKHPKMRESTVSKRIDALCKIIRGEAKPDRNTAGLFSMLRDNGIYLCRYEGIDTLRARDVMPRTMQASAERMSEVIAERLIKSAKKHFLDSETARQPSYTTPYRSTAQPVITSLHIYTYILFFRYVYLLHLISL